MLGSVYCWPVPVPGFLIVDNITEKNHGRPKPGLAANNPTSVGIMEPARIQ